MTLLVVTAFGMLGVLARYAVVSLLGNGSFPYATFLVNGLGAFLGGLFYVIANERFSIANEFRIGVMLGFLGGFTTFSAYVLEIAQFIETGRLWMALGYFFFSSVIGMGAVFAGFFVARSF